MVIAIDASRAIRPQPTGTERYSARIIQYLAEIDHDNTYWLYSPTPPPADFPKLPNNFIWKVIPFPRLWTHIRLSFALWQDKPDVLFVPAHVLPLYIPKKTVITIHDLAYEIFPEAYSRFSRWYNRWADQRASKVATQIITPSQSTKSDLIKLFKVPAGKVVAIPLAVDEAAVTQIDAPAAIKKLEPFFLMVGRVEARKNTALAISAFAQFKQEYSDLPHKLVIIGKPGYGYETVRATIDALPKPIAKDVIEVGYASDTDLAAYRQSATAFIYPSLYEGFGLPLLEAMQAGIPIIASDSSSIPEVVDEAAILVNPESADELAKAMYTLATSDLSCQQIAERGKERVKDFSWQKTALATLQVLKGLS